MRPLALLTAFCALTVAACGGDSDTEPPSTEQLQAWADELIGPDLDCETSQVLGLPVTGWEGDPDVPEPYRDIVVGLAIDKYSTQCAFGGSDHPTPLIIIEDGQLQEWAEELAQRIERDGCPGPDEGQTLVLTWTGEPKVPEPYQDEVSDLAISILESRCAEQTPR